MQELRPRLKAAAAMVPPGSVVADIGTDHAYLPAFLLLSGVCPRVIACDVGEKPLRNAAETVKIYHLDEKIDLRISDGLQKVRPEEYDAVTVCGMGGTLIGLLVLKTFNKGMLISGGSTYLTSVLSGALLIVALTLDVFSRRRQRKRLGV